MWKPATAPNANSGTKTPEAAKTSTPSPAATPAATSTTTTTTTMTEPTPVAAPRNAALNTNEQATIGKSLVIKGEVTGSESLYIDGRVEGSINLPGNRVTVGRNGVVNANVNAREVVVIGKLKGNLTASDRVDIRNEGSLTGDVVAQRISIEDGAFFKGGIDIRKPGQNQKMDPANETKELAAASRTA
jgi:cytoskeletal protein CcmA (bactofilin family)